MSNFRRFNVGLPNIDPTSVPDRRVRQGIGLLSDTSFHWSNLGESGIRKESNMDELWRFCVMMFERACVTALIVEIIWFKLFVV